MKLHSKKVSNWKGRKITAKFRKNREIVRNRDAGHCVRCFVDEGRINPGHEVDHYIPDTKGGTDDLSNLWLLCQDCHRIKTQRESNGLSGFPTRIGLDGWEVPDRDWLEIIEERNRLRLEGLNL